MKYTYHISAYITVIMLVALTACKKSFLEVIPTGKLVAKTTEDYSLLLNNLDLININANAQVLMGDEVAAVDPYFSAAVLKTQRSFRWDDTIYEPQQDADEIAPAMKSIYAYNKVISEVPNSTGGTEQEKRAIAAQARAGRAWTYFLLINYFGKPYNAATAATDPGFPIVEAADVTAITFSRASVQKVYDFIIEDLETAIPDLPAQVTYRTRISKAAAEGILGKVYVFMGRFSDALPILNATIADMANQSTPVRLYDYNTEFTTGGAFFPINPSSGPPSIFLHNNIESLYSKQFFNNWTISFNEIVTTPQTSALYGSSDLRLKLYVSSTSRTNIPYPVGGLLRRQSSGQTLFGVLVPELYLLRAECKCRNNDLNGAKTDVEILRTKRMPAADAPVPASIAGQQMPLLKFILEERIREFALQGFRWFDMRRLSVDPLFSSNTYTHTLYSATGSTTTFQLRPERFVLRFPQKLVDQNPGFENNP